MKNKFTIFIEIKRTKNLKHSLIKKKYQWNKKVKN